MSKQKVFLDFDGTLVNAVKRVVEIYNSRTGNNADWKKVRQWNFADQCPGIQPMIKEIFASDEFYEGLEFFNKNTLEVLGQLRERYDVIVCTIGCWENVSKKVVWIKQNANHENVILIAKDNEIMDKSVIDMSGGIIVDDHKNNLLTSNAKTKISFGTRAEWNEGWNGQICLDWSSLGESLLK